MTKKRRKSRKKARRQESKALLSFAILFLCVFAAIIGSEVYLDRAVSKFDSRLILPGVSIGGMDVSGLTAGEAKAKAGSSLGCFSGVKFRFIAGDGREAVIPCSEMNVGIKDLDEIVSAAVKYGKKGNLFERFQVLKLAGEHKLKKDFPIRFEIREEDAKGPISKAFEGALASPKRAYLTLNADKTVSVIEDQKGEAIDIKRTVDALNDILKKGVSGGTQSAKIFFEEVHAEVTAQDLAGLTDILGEFTTYYGADGSGRALNIEQGARLVSDVLLKPGQEFSVQEIMGPTTEENGFFEADSYDGDEVVKTFGGGICQVSSTLYNAVLMAELEVTERYAHSLQVTYVEPSRDATIADGLLDFKFVNNRQEAVYVQSAAQGGYLSFYIYGREMRDPSRSIKYITEITDKKVHEGKKFKAADEPVGRMHVVHKASPEVFAQLVKVVYEDGAEQDRSVENYSHYLGNQELVEVGVKSDDPEETEDVKRAIDTQDEEEIKRVLRNITGKELTVSLYDDSAGTAGEGGQQ